jgi:hypothetical protein
VIPLNVPPLSGNKEIIYGFLAAYRETARFHAVRRKAANGTKRGGSSEGIAMILQKEKEKNHHRFCVPAKRSEQKSLDITSRNVCIIAALRKSGFAVVRGQFARQIVRAA